MRNYTDDELKLKLFSQSLTNTALSRYRTCPAEMIDTWENLKKEFIFRFYRKFKSAEARRDITNFKNGRGESLMRAYLWFKGTIQKCPHHDLPHWYVLHVFYGGLEQDNKRELDLLSGGSFMELATEQACIRLDKVHRNRVSWGFNLGSEGEIEIEYDCLNSYKNTGKLKRNGQ